MGGPTALRWRFDRRHDARFQKQCRYNLQLADASGQRFGVEAINA
jgi:hypothetical protein